MAGYYRHGTELSHRAGVAENHTIHQAPAHLRQGHAEEGHPTSGPQGDRGLLLVVADLLHQRNQLARHVGERHQHGGQNDSGHGEDDADIVVLQPRPEPAPQAEYEHVDHARDHGRDRQRQVDEGNQKALAREFELGDRPGGRQPENRIQGDHDQCREQGQSDGGKRVGVAEAVQVEPDALGEGGDEHRCQRRQQQCGQEQERQRDEGPADDRARQRVAAGPRGELFFQREVADRCHVSVPS